MSDPLEPLILDLLEWLAKRDRSYSEVMDAWRTSCPKLPAWEDANDRQLIQRVNKNGLEIIRLTASGQAILAQRRPSTTRN
jgi:hypothetical protein